MAARQECSICIDSFKSPKLLPCHHSFCYKCLEDYVRVNLRNGQFHCPLCRTCVDLPKLGVSDFPTKLDIVTDSSENFPCDLCGLMNVACVRCLDCEENYCMSCCNYHEKFKLSKHHKICDLGIMDPEMKGKIRRRIFCEEHVEEEIKLVCKTCNVLICLLCKAIHHESHASKTLADAAAEIKRKLEAELNQCTEKQKHLDVSTKESKELEAKINNAEQEEMKATNQQHSKFLTILDQEVMKIKNKIKTVYDKLRKENDSFSRVVENQRKILSCAKESAQELIDQDTYIEMIRKGPDVLQSLSGVKLSTNPITRLDQKLFAPAEINSPELSRLFGTMSDSTEKNLRKNDGRKSSNKMYKICKEDLDNDEEFGTSSSDLNMFCSGHRKDGKMCGARLNYRNKFCMKCGSRVNQRMNIPSEAARGYCTVCSNLLEEEDKFCIKCGTSRWAEPHEG